METLKPRILLRNMEGATIAYLYTPEAFNLLKIEMQDYDHSKFIEVEDHIEFEEQEYIVKKINIKFFNKTIEIEPRFGVNLYSATERADYNCQIGIFLQSIHL